VELPLDCFGGRHVERRIEGHLTMILCKRTQVLEHRLAEHVIQGLGYTNELPSLCHRVLDREFFESVRSRLQGSRLIMSCSESTQCSTSFRKLGFSEKNFSYAALCSGFENDAAYLKFLLRANRQVRPGVPMIRVLDLTRIQKDVQSQGP
jgi:hypothetical protein